MAVQVLTADEVTTALATLSARVDAQAALIGDQGRRLAVLEGATPDPDPDPDPPTPVPTGWLSGAGVGDPYAFGSWRGRPVEVWETWNNFPDWPTMLGIPTVHTYFTGEGKAPFNRRFPGRLSFSQPLWAVGESATTDNTANFTNLGKALAAAGFPDAFIRLGWEFNGSWYRWSARDPANWVKSFQRASRALKAVSSQFRIVWNPNRSSDFGLDARTCWPGQDVVDVVGVDLYNTWPPAHDEPTWNAQLNQTGGGGIPIGPGAWKTYAASVGKPFAVPEWGQDAGDGNLKNSSGDDVAYIRGMRALFASGGVAYESYFNLQGDKFQLYPPPGRFPNSSAEYKRLWAA